MLEEGAEASVWHESTSADDDAEGLVNGVVELVVGANARLRFVDHQALGEKTWVFGAQRATVDRDGWLDWITLGFGSANGKVFQETQLAGPGAHGSVTGAYASRGRQHLDFDTLQEHAAPDTTSDLAFRGILAGRASAVWRGMIKVDEGAQRTDAFQESRNLLLSKRAHADAIPGLEILANDVRCTHAAAIAQIDKDQVFYLRSHGLSEADAQRLVDRGLPAGARRAPARRGRCARPSAARSSAGSSRCSGASPLVAGSGPLQACETGPRHGACGPGPGPYGHEHDRRHDRRPARGGRAGIMGIPRSLGGALRRLGADTLYLGLGLPMGILTFTWVVTGWSLSLGLMITLIGLPLAVVTIVVSRALATVERQRAALVLGSAVPSGTAGRSGRASWPSSGRWSATPRPGRTSPGSCCCCPSGSRASRSP